MNNKTIVALLAVALVISLTGTVMSVSKFSNIGSNWMILSGAVTSSATDTGNTTLEILANVGLNIEDSTIDIGSGYVNSTATHASVSSYPSSPDFDWLNASELPAGDINDYHLLNNTGSTTVNLTVQQNSGYQNAEQFLCGDNSTCPSDMAELTVRSSEGNSNSCILGLNSGYEMLLGDQINYGPVVICDQFQPVDGDDEIQVYYKVLIPQEAPTGQKTINLLYTAEAI
ncbi:hypothetical protein HN385_03740 [archaeon]|jgi:hypothetical protein|nr:hypothetical protein [archaeon]MBT3450860.1 hypothetical protein [archaeon]MBT6869042.1 hypothetical protein [archaeon]MBT7193285.1 hypothetical protein [archaeon]MBT7380293.1 hypothetical protein [archaeon]